MQEYRPPEPITLDGFSILPYSKWYPFLAGALYGLLIRLLNHYLPAWIHSMGSAMLLATPFVIGALTVYLAQRKEERSYLYYLFAPWLSCIVFMFSLSLFMLEGSICLWMAAPLLLPNSSFGGLLMGAYMRNVSKSRHTIQSIVLLPLLLGALEPRAIPDSVQEVRQSVYIAAPAGRIWQEINAPGDIKPAEFAGGLVYRIGVPYPLRAQVARPGVGGIRHSFWQRGVHFDEEITEWQEQRKIGWIYHFAADSFPPGSMDDHVVIGGRYFDLQHTRYTLTPEGGGTRLELTVRFRVSTGFNWYAAPMAQWLLEDTAQSMLKFYQQRTENRAQTS